MRFASLLGVGLVIVSALGCNKSPPLGVVQGVVLVNGQPGEKLRVEFHPDARRGTHGPSSFAETDAKGHFSLVAPVAVGWHKVVVQDMKLAMSETGQGIEMRIPPDYARVLATPLDAAVKVGEQMISIEVPKK